ncbi:MAG: prepilin-type N-terminal cleavage/methylation domain-containing protein [Magnetococcales bacterium]|nr:prepilin-type N-terminal cleavage/methylation domain-containing protein [Magnetococcales bacterium]
MEKLINKLADQQRREGGFTLIEMALVLVIIGLVLGAVSIGKDLQRNAEYKRIVNKFIAQWGQAYNQYYERTGVVLLDSQSAPSGKVGGTTGSVAASAAVAEMRKYGIRMPTGSGQSTAAAGDTAVTTAGSDESSYLYLDQSGIPHALQVSFTYGSAASTVSGIMAGNMMKIINMVPTLVSTMDQIIDGRVDATNGVVRYAGLDWDTTNTAAGSANQVNATERLETVTDVYWKMNQ